ncbi:hypothetical protein DXN05_17435 [Deminuibacter soli]|uniref:Mannose-6-phosphate isomerase n=1 Tax=Deminuibacter soli TaxID=2291815 RepID=A0A3E1NG70_9BACT|nr:hypothetical protein DXN05_17435 [Deminuibacter soli]
MAGAAHLAFTRAAANSTPKRQSKQPQLPAQLKPEHTPANGYRLFPFETLGNDHIQSGYDSLAQWIITQRNVRIDGYEGLYWDEIRTALCFALRKAGVSVYWYDAAAFQQPASAINDMIAPFIGTPGAVWGKRTSLSLADFFDPSIAQWQPQEAADVIIFAGTGAGLAQWNTPVVYIDLPKNELQYRMRAGSAFNTGSTEAIDFAEMYKRAFFVDWIVLAAHRQQLYASIAVIADGQWQQQINWAFRSALEQGLNSIAHNVIRNRPWFESGVWGGQWMKQHIPQLAQDEINYAWSFELIAPENGLVFESNGYLLEVSFDWLMETHSSDVLGEDAARFGTEFPIRFDFLDTVDGDNLSIQCHPSLSYIQTQFGENITQDETYYILDCQENASVYLGFTENADPATFRAALEHSQQAGETIDITQYVQKLPAAKHDLFLIPNQTVHGAGTGNLVLEISATPYIYTFKMYDWMRLDLNGRPRPINIQHAFENLDFSRKGQRVQQELVSQPLALSSTDTSATEWLPTHPEHFYAIRRISLPAQTGYHQVYTTGKCHLLMVVEGDHVQLKTKQGKTVTMRYAETYVVPAAAEYYVLSNNNEAPAKIVQAFVK